MENKIMKKLNSSLSRLVSGIGVLFLIFSISNSCTKTEFDQSGTGVSLKPSGSGYGITIQGGFNPAEFNISAGTMVTWINNGSAIESVTSDDGLFDGILKNGDTYSHVFMSAGTYFYYSRMHPNMIGKVVVN